MYSLLSVETNNEEAVHHAVSFAAANTYIGLPQMKAYNSINIRFQFRTFESNGLLMYNAGMLQIRDTEVVTLSFLQPAS